MKNTVWRILRNARIAVTVGSFLIGYTAMCSQGYISGVVGGVAILPIESSVTSVSFQEKSQLIVGQNAIIGIPLATELTAHSVVTRHDNGDTVFHALMVEAKQYPEERITIDNENFVTPPPLDLERIRRETQLMRDVYALFTDHPTVLSPIMMPVEGRISGVFGSRRFFNDQPRNPHSGLDIAAPAGTPIKTPAPAEVSLTGDFFFNGKTVMLDHGGGFVSMMCHLDEIHVKQGDRVDVGDVLGTVGSTGRSTGPHLHWSISLAGDRIDPQDFIPKFNALLDAE